MSWIVPPHKRVLTPKRYHRRNRAYMVKNLELIIFHYTASPWRDGEHQGSSPAKVIRWLEGAKGSSTHLVVYRDGGSVQGAPLTDRTWHSGGSVAKLGRKTIKRVNGTSIGLDLDNVGPVYPVDASGHLLRKTADADRFVDSYERRRLRQEGGAAKNFYKGPDPYQHEDGTWWEPYSSLSIVTTMRLVARIVAEYPRLQGDPRRLLHHSQIIRGKIDPGPAFPHHLMELAASPSFDPSKISRSDLNEPGIFMNHRSKA